MEKISGTTANNGIVIGKILYLDPKETIIERKSFLSPSEEKERYRSARNEAVEALNNLFNTAKESAGESSAMVFSIQAMMLEDLDYVENVEGLIDGEQCTAEYAVQETGEKFRKLFASMDDEYMKGRAADVDDITSRLIRNLNDIEESNLNHVNGKVILACEDLMPSQTIQLDKTKILGFVTQKGSKNSHVSILARSLNIPSLVNLGINLRTYHNKTAILDGDSGILWLDPDESTISAYNSKMVTRQEEISLLNTLVNKPNQTADGLTIEINGNIGHPEECNLVKQNGGDGIGLFRSEFLYMESDAFPSEDKQFHAYKNVLEAMENNRVIIRTLDIGADKKVPYFNMEAEENPALGLRAIRISLANREIFNTQMRALLRASVYGRLAIMFPMIISVEEVQSIKTIVAEIKSQLFNEGIPVADNIELGIMIETPAAALISDLLAMEVDFFSFGTNDLTQYTLAVDRMNPNVGKLYDAGHLGILRLMKFAADNAHKHGKWVGICGESAADVKLLPYYLSIGIDELSVAPTAILKLRAAMLSLDISKVRDNLLNQLSIQ